MTEGNNNGIIISLDELVGLHAQGTSLSLGTGQGRNQMSGNYRSAFRGRGMDFEEVRAYQAGDDIRRMDWRVTARSNRPHTKLFREERERPVILCVDSGINMRFGTRVAFKSVQAIRLAALLGWASLENHDRVGCMIFGNRVSQETRPASGKRGLLHSLHLLAESSIVSATAKDEVPLLQTLLRLRHLARHGCLVILISDFNSLNSVAEQQFTALARHNEVLAIRVHDPLEAELPPPNEYAVSDGQHMHTLWTADPETRKQYHAEFMARSEYLATLCRNHGVHWLSVSTEQDPFLVLQQHLQHVRHRHYSAQRAVNAIAM